MTSFEKPSEFSDYIITFNKSLSDPIYGVRLLKTQFWLGKSPIIFKDKSIYVADKKFKETPGLLKLLFYRNPEKFSLNDLNTYKVLLMLTSAHRYDNEPNKRIKANPGLKYKTIISKMFPPEMRVPKEKLDLIWKRIENIPPYPK